MRALIQRVSFAKVEVDGQIVGQIQKGILTLLGIGPEDSEKTADKLFDKISKLRIFEDDQKNFIKELEKEQAKQEKVQKGLIIPKKTRQKSNDTPMIDPELQKQLDEAERAKEELREFNRKKLIEAEKKKMLLEQKLREIDKEIHTIETSVSQRILEESELQNQEIIKKIVTIWSFFVTPINITKQLM